MGNYAGNYAVSLKVPRQERTLGLSAVHIIERTNSTSETNIYVQNKSSVCKAACCSPGLISGHATCLDHGVPEDIFSVPQG